MGKRKTTMSLLILCLLLLAFIPNVVFASSENWVEVTRYGGSEAFFGDTNSFTINHSAWRIRWEFEEGPLRGFLFYIKINETNQTIGSYTNSGKLNVTEGIYNVTDYSGEFYIFIGTTGGYYSIIVEQNLDAVPEFTSWIILPICLTATLAVIITRKRLQQHHT